MINMNYYWYYTILLGAVCRALISCRTTRCRMFEPIFKLPAVRRSRPPERELRRSRRIGKHGPLRRWQQRWPGVRAWGHWSIRRSTAQAFCAGRLLRNRPRLRLPAYLTVQGWLRRQRRRRPWCPPGTFLHSGAWHPFSAVSYRERERMSSTVVPGHENVTAARASRLAGAAGVMDSVTSINHCSVSVALLLSCSKTLARVETSFENDFTAFRSSVLRVNFTRVCHDDCWVCGCFIL